MIYKIQFQSIANQILLTICLLSITVACNAQPKQPTTISMNEIRVGASQMEEYLPLLKNKNVAVLANHSSLVNDKHLIDTLLSLNIKITKVFAPEHGFRGDKPDGTLIDNTKDSKTGLPVISMYGNNKTMPETLLDNVDVLLFDIQDVGVRFFTFISAMHYAMQACAAKGIPFIVLDRPNPNGMYVDGPVLDSAQQSYVGMHPIPVVHGLTVGELAMMINGEGWLGDKTCNLTVIKAGNYDHGMNYNLPIKPSPNLPSDKSIILYPSLALFEGTVISVGRGTYEPFLQIGHPSLKEMPHSFKPVSIPDMSSKPPLENQLCFGYSFKNIEAKPEFTLRYLLEFYVKFEDKDKFFLPYFNKLIGNGITMKQIKQGMSESEIKASWEPDLSKYKQMRKKYLLYTDFE